MKVYTGKNQRGDTIVEVMFALVVLAIALGVSYGVANRSLKATRSAQERTEALKVTETQAERLKYLANNNFALPPDAGELFCIPPSYSSVTSFSGVTVLPLLGSALSYPADCDLNDRYYFSIEPLDNNKYELVTRWFGSGSLSAQEVRFTYRVK